MEIASSSETGDHQVQVDSILETLTQEESPAENKQQSTANILFEILKPAVETIDKQVGTVRDSQHQLSTQLELVSAELEKIGEKHIVDFNIDPYVKKLVNTRRRIVLVSNIIQNVQDRVIKLHRSVEKETARRKAVVEAQSALLDVSTPSEEQ